MEKQQKAVIVRSIVVWDLPVRLFHWTLVALLIVAWSTAQGGLDWMRYHLLAGYAILALVAFRLMWGFFGGFHARFSSFLASPRAAWRYGVDLAQGHHQAYPGHNPLGGYMVLLLLALVLTQVVTGLFATDDIFFQGPLASHVPARYSRLATAVHKVNINVLIAAVALHVIAIAYYRWRLGENLVKAMFTGKKDLEVALDRPPAQTEVSIWRAFILGMLSIALAAWIATGL
ncbi:MAG TPA: cytochrome b/b6 domain-containing protein [Candidatus Acidoferrales bacterium]|nr:cytochrome b/b6 domain-containing protein [Candidatus Acidoferrales bacterium]